MRDKSRSSRRSATPPFVPIAVTVYVLPSTRNMTSGQIGKANPQRDDRYPGRRHGALDPELPLNVQETGRPDCQ